MTASQIRKTFLDFFKSKSHSIVPSAPIVIKNDPTLLFTNAGMNQFKDFFLGNKEPESRRVADTQKCLRVSGKHNDLEEVGVDTYHHTMFEMLGNWSFGDYFKKEAIEWSWELLTKAYQLDADRMYVTIFEGDEKEGLSRDTEAFEEWKKWVPEERILTGNKKDNFWEMGDTGPCGPCSEIHFDSRTDEERKIVDGRTLVNADHPQVIEIWNLVFMQFNRKKDGSLESLPEKHVDTGMGFERLVRVLQGKQSNYDTDVFTDTIKVVEQITGKKYDFSDSKEAIAFRVISDHIRAVSFAIADGQLPSNTGAGYVIRRILRRAVRYYYSHLDFRQPLLYQLLPHLAKQFQDVFPEIEQQKTFISRVIKEEEEGFLRTLESGLKRMSALVEDAGRAKKTTIDGDATFELYDTHGFPLDLTRLIASEHGLHIDEQGFDKAMQQQKDRARKATAIDAGDWTVLHDGIENKFIGYEHLTADTRVLRFRKVEAKNKIRYQIVLEETPFYAEMGGQVGDTGSLKIGDEVIYVTDTQKENDLIIHWTDKLASEMSLDVAAKVDIERRQKILCNHSGTHLVHAALRKVLGNHVHQKGSLVSPEVLRFDIAHFAKITDEEIEKVAQIVNQKIRENVPVVIKELPKEEAMNLGAMALFGEKYGNIVRVVTIDPSFSVELCGGTHVNRTGDIGAFVITAESAVAAGVRRIEALTGGEAMDYLNALAAEHKAVVGLLKTKEPLKAVEKLMDEKSQLEKKLTVYESKERNRQAKELVANAEIINGLSFVGKKINCNTSDDLKKTAFEMKALSEDLLAILTASINGKAAVAVFISDKVVSEKGLDAGKIIKEIVSPLIKGGGGGQATLATAGGQNVDNLDEAIQSVRSLVSNT